MRPRLALYLGLHCKLAARAHALGAAVFHGVEGALHLGALDHRLALRVHARQHHLRGASVPNAWRVGWQGARCPSGTKPHFMEFHVIKLRYMRGVLETL